MLSANCGTDPISKPFFSSRARATLSASAAFAVAAAPADATVAPPSLSSAKASVAPSAAASVLARAVRGCVVIMSVMDASAVTSWAVKREAFV
jgi:hypothetical protein